MSKIKRVSKDIEDSYMKQEKKQTVDPVFIDTGSTVLNCCLSDKYDGGYKAGTIVNLIGDSSAGKTFVAMTSLACISKKSNFDNYRLIFDDSEFALAFDINYLFGEKLEKRLEKPEPSRTIEKFYSNVLNCLEKNEPFIYILDSFDSISSDAEKERAGQYRDEKNVGGSFKTEKQRMASEILRNIAGDISKTNSLVIIISQTRDNLGFGAQFNPKVRSGGKALKFYSSHEIWLACGKKHKKKDEIIGVDVNAKITKNKQTGKIKECIFPIFYDLGIDDISSGIDWLLEKEFWKKEKRTVNCNDFDLIESATKEKIIVQIEDSNLENEFCQFVGKKWIEFEDSLKLNRKRRF